MPFTNFTNLDFDQIKTSIKDYLRANSNFTDFDFEGSNFSVLIDTLAYNTYITAFNSNMVVNESFLDSATLRENVVSLARNIGYVPYSRKAATAVVSFDVQLSPIQQNPIQYTPTISLQPGLVCTGSVSNSSYLFSIPETITATVNQDGIASFNNVEVKEGVFITKEFTFNGSLDQRFILDNAFVDISTIRVYVKGLNDSGLGKSYKLVDNIFNINSNSEIFLIQEIKDEKYELLFGDGIFGKKLENNQKITVTYVVTGGKTGNGAKSFSFSGSLRDSDNKITVPATRIAINTIRNSENGSEIESIDSIKYFAPRLYSSQYRAVTPKDYEALIKSKIYPNTEAISIVGGEELNPPKYGKVVISIKPKNGTFISDFEKQTIRNKLKQYSITGIDSEIIDLKILYVEIDSSIYYNNSQVGSIEDLKTRVIRSLRTYAESPNLNSFGGRFKYSKLLQVIDNTDIAITSNITKIKIRRDLKALINVPTQYELCYGNQFHVTPEGKNIKSTGFYIFGETSKVYFTDTPNTDLTTGTISIVKESPVITDLGNESEAFAISIVVQSAGTVNYVTGEIILNPIVITGTDVANDIIQIQAYPESNDVIGLKDLYLSFSISKSKINMVRDVIASGDDTSGVLFSNPNYYRSSYSNGELKRL